jgi:methylmalonyl-CoA mutase
MSRPEHPVRFVTAASLFDGHDAAINIMRRILQAQGAEVIHLGHNRAVHEIVDAAIQEDVQGIAISSYQGGHVEYFKYLVDLLRERGAGNVRLYGGGGGVIVPEEIEELHAYGVARIFTPQDGQELGLQGMIELMVRECDSAPAKPYDVDLGGGDASLAGLITAIELGAVTDADLATVRGRAGTVPVLGITGTGGSGKSSLTDELVRLFRIDQQDKLRIAVIAIDPTRRRGGGALLGDRIRMNSLSTPEVFFRSLATRSSVSELPECLGDVIAACKGAGYDLVVVETPGIGQGDAAIVPFVDVPLYVMTPEYGASSQLEKIDMIDFAEAIAINKFERRGADDAVRDVRKQVARSREAWGVAPEDLPVFGTIAARFDDDGVAALYHHLKDRLADLGLDVTRPGLVARPASKVSSKVQPIIPARRGRYLGEIAESLRAYHAATETDAVAARLAQHLDVAATELHRAGSADAAAESERLAAGALAEVSATGQQLLTTWPEVSEVYRGERVVSLSGTPVPRVAVPSVDDHGALLRFLRRENLPGQFPFTAGVFPFKREDEDPTRMFAGEGDAFKTNRRFHLLAEHSRSTRLSTAFDSVTLYGFDPAVRPDIYGKVGNAGVSIATVDDMRELFAGFDLCSPTTSVSMTINGPAPAILAMYFNAAVDQKVDAFTADHGRAPALAELEDIRQRVFTTVRGTVQADILKEDQGQNTCIFSTEFALRMMSDVQQWFVDNGVRSFYSVSISGYHIAEAGANPISQLAFTLANGFTYVEAYLARGMDIDDIAPNLSFFFSNGMDPEYSVLGRVARRIWAVAMRERYRANERSQRLKYHIQTSGRSLHAQEMAFNDFRTTLQALCAIYDNCNSLHTNAYDEAVTTPTDESVRRALAIQMVINREWGLAKNENPLQGSFVIDELTDLVEEAVLAEFERLNERGGVLGAMELGYQRGKIQDDSMLYETKKHDGSLPIVGVNTFVAAEQATVPTVPLARSTNDEKESQLRRLEAFRLAHRDEQPKLRAKLQAAATNGGNVFGVLMEAVRCMSLGEITDALFEVGGQYRRNL